MLQVNQRLLAPPDETLPRLVEIYDDGKYYRDREDQHGRGEDLALTLASESISHQDSCNKGDNTVHIDDRRWHMVLEGHPTCRLQVNDLVQGLQK